MASGLVLIDKPQDITSFDVVAKLRKILNTRKIGHAGTLDPMATGLMVLGVESGTKLLQYLIGMDKQYLATIRLGAATVTDDAQGEKVSEADASQISAAQIDAEILKLTGDISQLPSSVSAKKIAGKRAYELVREGKPVELKPKDVTISRFERTSEPKPAGTYLDFDVLVDCSSGTYVRALARDIGERLRVGGHLTSLRRTRIGQFYISDAQQLGTELSLTPLAQVARELFEIIEISEQTALEVRQGKPVKLESEHQRVGLIAGDELVAIFESAAGRLRSSTVFPKESE